METDVKLKVVVVGQPGQPCLKKRPDRDPHERSRPGDQHVAVGRPQDASRHGKGEALRMPVLGQVGGVFLLWTYAVPSS